MPKPKIDYDAAVRFSMILMYSAYINDEDMNISPEYVAGKMGVPKNIIRVTFETLVSSASIERTVVGPPPLYRLTQKGRQWVENLSDDVFDLATASVGPDGSQIIFSRSPSPNMPNSPQRWEPLPLEQGDVELQVVKNEIDKVLEIVEGENGYKVEHPDERAGVLSALTGAKTMIAEAEHVSYSTFVTYFVRPIKQLLSRFPVKTVVGATVELLWAAVKVWVQARIKVNLDDIFPPGK